MVPVPRSVAFPALVLLGLVAHAAPGAGQRLEAHNANFFQLLHAGDYAALGTSEGALVDFMVAQMSLNLLADCLSDETLAAVSGDGIPGPEEGAWIMGQITARHPLIALTGMAALHGHEITEAMGRWIQERGCDSRDTAVLARNYLRYMRWIGQQWGYRITGPSPSPQTSSSGRDAAGPVTRRSGDAGGAAASRHPPREA